MSFESTLKKITAKTLVSENRLRVIYDKVLQTKDILGSMAEIGVYKGGCSQFIHFTNPEKVLYACDSFEGLPEPIKGLDLHNKGDFSDVVFHEVSNRLNLPNVKVIKGFFPNPDLHDVMYNDTFSFVHIDVDLYQPTLDCLNFFYPRLAFGGVLVSDDYLWPNCPGVKTAFDEFLKDKPEVLVDTKHKSCYFVKRDE